MQGVYAGIQPDSEADKLISAISYIFSPIVPIIILLTPLKESRFNKVHAYQGLVFLGAAVAYYVLYGCAFFIASSVNSFLACVLWIGYLVPFVIALLLGFRVYTNKQVEFPYLTQATASVFKDM